MTVTGRWEPELRRAAVRAPRAFGLVMPKQIVIPEELVQQMIAELSAGSSLKLIVETFGFSRYTITNTLNSRGIVTSDKASQTQKDVMVALYLEGKTPKIAAATFGFTDRACVDELKRRGIKPRDKFESRVNIKVKQRTPLDVQLAIVALYQEGYSTKEVASMRGVNATTVTNFLKKHGVPARPIQEAYALRNTRPIKRKKRPAVSYKASWGKFSNSPEYKRWRKQVLKRDKRTCLECGKTTGIMEAHHIFRKKTFPALALDVQNGITLCRSCHNGIRGKEVANAPRFLSKIDSTIAPLIYFEKAQYGKIAVRN